MQDSPLIWEFWTSANWADLAIALFQSFALVDNFEFKKKLSPAVKIGGKLVGKYHLYDVN